MVVKGNILFTKNKDQFEILENGYLVIQQGLVVETTKEYTGNEPILDHSGRLIIPPFVDLHLHANQYANCGLGNEEELLVWLEKYTFKEEVKFKDPAYAETIFKIVLNRLWECGSLRSVVFASLYTETTALMFELALQSGLSLYVGKVNMDRNSAEYYMESTEESIRGTQEIIDRYAGVSDLVKPIITPRFVPHCTVESMDGQGKMAKKFGVPVQSHINESLKEINWVKKLHPHSNSYAGVYEEHGLFGEFSKSIMAHAIYNTKEEMELMKKRGVYPVHCPESNANLMSGIMEVKEMLEADLPVSMGSDISGGHHLYLPAQMVLALQLSKMKARLENELHKALTFSEVFYMATKSGGSFFGQVGSFEPGYEGDFLVVDPQSIMVPQEKRSPLEQLEKFIYIGSSDNIIERYIRGNKVEKPF